VSGTLKLFGEESEL